MFYAWSEDLLLHPLAQHIQKASGKICENMGDAFISADDLWCLFITSVQTGKVEQIIHCQKQTGFDLKLIQNHSCDCWIFHCWVQVFLKVLHEVQNEDPKCKLWHVLTSQWTCEWQLSLNTVFCIKSPGFYRGSGFHQICFKKDNLCICPNNSKNVYYLPHTLKTWGLHLFCCFCFVVGFFCCLGLIFFTPIHAIFPSLYVWMSSLRDHYSQKDLSSLWVLTL